MGKYWSLTKLIRRNINNLQHRNAFNKFSTKNVNRDHIIVSAEIMQGFADGKPIVALESTIITHGMPFPKNLETAMDVEKIIRNSGALPATIAITNGKINVGMVQEDLCSLAEKSSRPGGPVKVSKRDLPYVIASRMDGGTTVAGTMMIADMVGIPVFVTGGIGGVHRGGHESLDVSADLTELGRTPVCVVSSGVKSILDIGRTLEFLETQGVCVATYGSSADFPAFYTRKSGFKSPCCVKSALDAAKMVKSVIDLKIRSGLLIAVPVPEEFSMDERLIEEAIQKSLQLAKDKGVRGKEITPLILGAVAEITKGKSLQTNMALIKNNAKVGARIAVELKKLESSPPPSRGGERSLQETPEGQKEKLQINLDTVVRLSTENSIFLREQTKREISPVIIGGSNVDSTVKILEPEIALNGSTHRAKVTKTWGGVGRNIAECLCKLSAKPILLTALDNDADKSSGPFSLLLECRIPPPIAGCKNASYTAILDHKGECQIGLGDMEIHDNITPDWIMENRAVFKMAPLIVMDGNISIPAMECVLKLAQELKKPVLFEPTDINKALKPFKTEYWKSITYTTPNLNELYAIGSMFGYDGANDHNDVENITKLATFVSKYIDNLIVTMGNKGILVVRKEDVNTPFNLENEQISSGPSNIRFYPITNPVAVKNVSGAGDCFAGGLIYSMLMGSHENICLSVACESAKTALVSDLVIPDMFFNENHPCWKTEREFKTFTL